MMLSEAHTAGSRSPQTHQQPPHANTAEDWNLQGDLLQANQREDLITAKYKEYKGLGCKLFLGWRKSFAKEHARVGVLFPELQRRMEYEAERTKYFQTLVEDMSVAKNAIQREEGATLESDEIPPLDELLKAVGPEPCSIIGESREHVVCIKAEFSNEGYLMQLVSDCRDRFAGACLAKQPLTARQEMGMVYRLLPGLVESMRKRAVAAGYIADRLDAALVTCNAREEVISAAIKRVVRNIRALLARAKNQQRGPAAASPAAAVAPPDRPANSMLGLMDTWESGLFYDRFLELTRSTNDDTAIFLATELLSQRTQWNETSACLGGGAFGVVDKIDVHTLGESFALKVIKAGTGEGAKEFNLQSQEALMVEMAICTRVPRHPNVLGAVAIDDRNLSSMKIAYELASGDFTQCARGSTTHSAGTKMRYLSEVAMGALHLAQHGYVQNDIKPGNVLLFAPQRGNIDGRAALADFGCCLAIGDERRGEGTLGSRPPEANSPVSCHPSAEVFSLAHMCLVTFTKRDFKYGNMFASEAHMTDLDKGNLDQIEDYSKYQAYREAMTHRNMTDPFYVGKLLNPEHLLDELVDVKVEFMDIVGSALHADPTRRPTLGEMVQSLAGMSEHLLEMERDFAAASAEEVRTSFPEQVVAPQMAPLVQTSGGSGGGINVALLSNVVVGGVLVGGDGITGGAVVPTSTQSTREDEAGGPLVGGGGDTGELPVVGLSTGQYLLVEPMPETPSLAAVAAGNEVRLWDSSERFPRADSTASPGLEREDSRVLRSVYDREQPVQASGREDGDDSVGLRQVFPGDRSGGGATPPVHVHPTGDREVACPEVFGQEGEGQLFVMESAVGGSPTAAPALEDFLQRTVTAAAASTNNTCLHESSTCVPRVPALTSAGALDREDDRVPRAIFVDRQQEQHPSPFLQPQEGYRGLCGGGLENVQQPGMVGGEGNAAHSRTLVREDEQTFESNRTKVNQSEDIHTAAKYLEFEQLGYKLFSDWQKKFSKEHDRVAALLPELQTRVEYEAERTKFFEALVEDMTVARNAVRQEQRATLESNSPPPLAELLKAVGPETLSVVREARQQVMSLEAAGMSSVGDLLMQRVLDKRDVSLVAKQALSARQEMNMVYEHLPGLVESMRNRAVEAGYIADRLETALLTCNAREEVISAAINRIVKNVRALLARAKNKQRGPAAASPAAAEAPPDRPANSMLGLMDTWESGLFYDRFLELTRSTNDDTAIFLATELLSETTQWYETSACLGGGAFGVVDKIDVHALGKSFALKVIKAGTGEGAKEFNLRSQEALMVEMAICTRVPRHSNVLGSVAIDDRSLSSMKIAYELASGDFAQCARGSTSHSAGTKLRYLSEVAMGALHLAQHGYVQNDIKPGNVLLLAPEHGSTDDRAALADFGCCLAIGDERRGEGTLGCRPPEANSPVSCHPSAEVFSLAHMCLVTFTKRDLKDDNMFASEAHMTDLDKDNLDHIEDYSKYQAYREAMTYRNMTDPYYVGKLLNPDYLLDELADVKVEFMEIVGSALHADPTRRPTLGEMVQSLAGMSEHLLEMERDVPAASAEDVRTSFPGQVPPPEMAPLVQTSGGNGDGTNVALLSNVVVGGVLVGGNGSAGGAVVPKSTQSTRQDEAGGPLVGGEGDRSTGEYLLVESMPEAPSSEAVAAAGRVRLKDSSERFSRAASLAGGSFGDDDFRVPRSVDIEEQPAQSSSGGVGSSSFVVSHDFSGDGSSGSAAPPVPMLPMGEREAAYPEMFQQGGKQVPATGVASGESPIAVPTPGDYLQRAVEAAAVTTDESRLHESSKRVPHLAPLASEGGLGDNRVPQAIFIDNQQVQHPRPLLEPHERNQGWCDGVLKAVQQPTMAGGERNATHSRTYIGEDGKVQRLQQQGHAPRAAAIPAPHYRSQKHTAYQGGGMKVGVYCQQPPTRGARGKRATGRCRQFFEPQGDRRVAFNGADQQLSSTAASPASWVQHGAWGVSWPSPSPPPPQWGVEGLRGVAAAVCSPGVVAPPPPQPPTTAFTAMGLGSAGVIGVSACYGGAVHVNGGARVEMSKDGNGFPQSALLPCTRTSASQAGDWARDVIHGSPPPCPVPGFVDFPITAGQPLFPWAPFPYTPTAAPVRVRCR